MVQVSVENGEEEAKSVISWRVVPFGLISNTLRVSSLSPSLRGISTEHPDQHQHCITVRKADDCGGQLMACQPVSVSLRSVAPASKQSLTRLVVNLKTRLTCGVV